MSANGHLRMAVLFFFVLPFPSVVAVFCRRFDHLNRTPGMLGRGIDGV